MAEPAPAFGGRLEHPAADTRDYAFSFAIPTTSELPADFALAPAPDPLLAGVFLPGDRGNAPRVLLIGPSEMIVASHPDAAEPLCRVPLENLVELESGRVLLGGWLSLTWRGGRKLLAYSNAHRKHVEAALTVLLDRWLPASGTGVPDDCREFGEPLPLKFSNALAGDLLGDEPVRARVWLPAARAARRWTLRRDSRRLAGNLLAVTPRRMLWIEERYRGRYVRYGTAAHSAPWNEVSGVRFSGEEYGDGIEVHFRSADCWRIAVRQQDARAACAFAGTVRRMLDERA